MITLCVIADVLLCCCVLVGIVMKHGSQVEMPLRINVITTQKDLWPKTSCSAALCSPIPALFLPSIYLLPTWFAFKKHDCPNATGWWHGFTLCVVYTRENISGCNWRNSQSGYEFILPYSLSYTINMMVNCDLVLIFLRASLLDNRKDHFWT